MFKSHGMNIRFGQIITNSATIHWTGKVPKQPVKPIPEYDKEKKKVTETKKGVNYFA